MDFATSLAIESWTLYGVGIVLIGIRMYSRIRQRGIKELQSDDYIMIFSTLMFTLTVATMNAITTVGGSNLVYPGEEETFTDEQIAARVLGSKITLVSEQAFITLIWSVKACMLIIYRRMTLGLSMQRALKALMVLTAAGYIAVQLTFCFACRPFNHYWLVRPKPDVQCSTFGKYAIVQGVFNILTDCLMLLVPLPLFFQVQLHWKRKFVLLLMSMAGVFVIVSAILKQVFYWRDIFSTEYINWTIREAATSVYVGNMAYLWTFCRQCFGFGSLDGGSAGGSRNYAKAGSSATGRSGQRSQGGYKMEVTSTTRPYRRTSIYGKSSESEESINGAHAESVPPGEIRTDVTFAVDIEDSHPRPSTMTQGSNDSSTLGIVNPQGRLREEV